MQILEVASNILKVSFRVIAPIHNKSHLMKHKRRVRPKTFNSSVINLCIKRSNFH